MSSVTLDGLPLEETGPNEAIRAACSAAKYQAAADIALRSYGAEILHFLTDRMRSPGDAEEVFSMFAEDMWSGLPKFEFRCTARAWLYTIARNASNRYATAPHRKREVVPALHASIADLVEQNRTMTQNHLRTEMKDRVRALRDRIAPEDQMLLMLHVDRGLPWRELAMVMSGEGEQLSSEAVTAEAARLRKRFERIKASLREMAIADGLIRGSHDD